MSPATFATNRTLGGYYCGEAASALQKCIRRSDEEGAIFWATELDLTGYGEYVWKRLRIMVSEDIGLAVPLMPAIIHGLYSTWVELRKKKDEHAKPERLQLMHAVILMARAPKSRIVDHACCVYYARPATRPHPEVPDVAIDKHTPRGRAMGRSWDHFWSEGSVLIGEPADLPDLYRERAMAVLCEGQPTTAGGLFPED